MDLALLFLFFCGGFIQNFITRLLITTTNRDLRWLNSASVYFVLVTLKYEKKMPFSYGVPKHNSLQQDEMRMKQS